MEVPCCKGIERAAVTAMKNSGKFIPWQVVTISTEGFIVEQLKKINKFVQLEDKVIRFFQTLRSVY